MAFANWKVAIFYVVNDLTVLRLSCSLHANPMSVIMLRFWAPESAEILRGVFTHNYWRFAFVFQIVALESGQSVQCQKTACRKDMKEASGNTLHHHTWLNWWTMIFFMNGKCENIWICNIFLTMWVKIKGARLVVQFRTGPKPDGIK